MLDKERTIMKEPFAETLERYLELNERFDEKKAVMLVVRPLLQIMRGETP